MRDVLRTVLLLFAMTASATACFKDLPTSRGEVLADAAIDSRPVDTRMADGPSASAADAPVEAAREALDAAPEAGVSADAIDSRALDAVLDASDDRRGAGEDLPVDERSPSVDGPAVDGGAAVDMRDCLAGARRCSPAGIPEACTNAGVWTAAPRCAFVCADGMCSGECVPDARRCAGTMAQVCSKMGVWTSSQTCPSVCIDGACAGVCVPGAKRCTSNVPETCDAGGTWNPGTACSFVCANGACAGECVPGAKRCASGVAESCGSDGRWGMTAGDCSAPTVLAVKPADGAVGVASVDAIEITFSEEMNKAAAQSAFSTADFTVAGAAFEWPAGNIMRIRPAAGLPYADGRTLSLAPRQIAVSILTSATDLAGNKLAAARAWTFATRRRITLDGVFLPALSGTVTETDRRTADDAKMGGYIYALKRTEVPIEMRGFMSFDISSIPADALVESAALNAYQFVSESDAIAPGANRVDHVSFPALDDSANVFYGGVMLGQLSTVLENGWRTLDVTAAVRADLDNRAITANRSQYRVVLTRPGQLAFYSAEVSSGGGRPSLTVTFVVP